MMDKASFIEGILQHYDGDNPQGLQEKLSKFYDVYKARRATLVGDPNGKNPSASLGVNEAHAFTA
jgi:flagellar motor component MotA